MTPTITMRYRVPLWRVLLLRLALACCRAGAWLAVRSGLGVTFSVRREPARCEHGRAIGDGYTCQQGRCRP